MNTIINNIVNSIFPKKVAKPVGRWNIDYCKVTPLDIENAQKVIANFTPYRTYLLKGYRR